jgi:hypothetical protein
MIGIVIGVLCLALLLVVAFTIVRYVAETSAIRMVDRHESTGERVSFREGWRLGWSRAAFRMWLVDLVFGLGVVVVFLALFALAAAPFLVWTTGKNIAQVIGTIAGSGLVVLVILFLVLVAAVLSLLGHFFHRAIALENLGVFEGIRRGWAVVRRRPGDAIIMGLILFGLGLVFAIVMIPVTLILLVVAGVAGGLPGLLVGALTNLFTQIHLVDCGPGGRPADLLPAPEHAPGLHRRADGGFYLQLVDPGLSRDGRAGNDPAGCRCRIIKRL